MTGGSCWYCSARMAVICSLCTTILLRGKPILELGRSITNRGGDSRVCKAGTTGLVDRISRAGAPRSCTMRILFTTATGTEVCELESAADGGACCEKVRTAPGDTSSTRHANWRAYRGNNIPWRPAQKL